MIDFAIEASAIKVYRRKTVVQAALLRFRPIMMRRWRRCSARCRWRWKAAPARSCATRSASPSSVACC